MQYTDNEAALIGGLISNYFLRPAVSAGSSPKVPVLLSSYLKFLMMEQTDSCKCHCHAVFVTCSNYIIITH